MDLTRTIYWNIGHGAQTLVPMYLLLLAATAVFARGVWLRLRVYHQGKDLLRTDNLSRRIVEGLSQVLAQARVMRVPGAGSAHGLFFYGFFILFLGTCLIFLQADLTDPLFGIQFPKGRFYLFFSLVLDVAGAVAVFMLAGLGFYRLDPLLETSPYPNHQRQLSVRRSRPQGGAGHSRHGGRQRGEFRRGDDRGYDLEGYLRQ